MAKNGVFNVFLRILSLVFPGNENKRSYWYWFSTTNPIPGKTLVLECQPRMLLSNQIAEFFELQYLGKVESLR